MTAPIYGKSKVHTVILAGGFGTRLNSISDPARAAYPLAKSVCPVGNLRVMDFSLRALAAAGLEDWHISVYHLPETIERTIGSGRIYGKNVRTHYDKDSPTEALDTAGSVARIVKEQEWYKDPHAVVVIPSADIIHNVPLEMLIRQHIQNREQHGAVATIVVNRVPWESVDRFGTVRLEGMPQRKDYQTDDAFEEAASVWIINHQAAARKIEDFREKCPRRINLEEFACVENFRKLLEKMPERKDFKKAEDYEAAVSGWLMKNQALIRRIQESRSELPPAENIFKEVCLSNLNNSSIYIVNANLFELLFEHLTRKREVGEPIEPLFPELYRSSQPVDFSDWAKHVFPWLIANGFPMFAYVLPEAYPDGTASYWRDTGLGEELRQASMDVLDGKIDTGLSRSPFWQIEPWGWMGRNVHIDPSARLNPRYKSIIGDGVVIGKGVSITHCVIREDTNIHAGAEMHGEVIFSKPLDRVEPNIIGEGAYLKDGIFTGGAVEPHARLDEPHIHYHPKAGLAIDSLYEKTKIPK